MSPPTKELEKLILSRKLIHNGNPILRWMTSNVTVRTDVNANIMPDKKKSTDRIDGVVATIIALARAMVHQDEGSVYETRGFITL